MNPPCMITKLKYPLLLFLLLLLIIDGYFTGASEGDERESFTECVAACSSALPESQVTCQLDSVFLKLSGWNCLADCKYRCMRLDVTKIRAQAGRIVQYYGKWPFVRVIGAQEVFSVLFSLGNFLACIYGYFFIYRNKKSTTLVTWMDSLHFVAFLITCNTWLQSALFHYRDTPVTEKLDYFSACLCILSSLPVALIRTLKVKSAKKQFFYFVLPVLLLYLQHIAYMTFVEFDYGYNVKFNAVFGISTNLVWLRYALFKLKSSAELKGMLLRFVGMNVASMAMVAFDFPPLFDLIDMHALWHLSTIPITIYWYKLLALDHQILIKRHAYKIKN